MLRVENEQTQFKHPTTFRRKFIVYIFINSISNSHLFNILTFLRRATCYVWYANKHNEINVRQRHSVTSKPKHFTFTKYRKKHLDFSEKYICTVYSTFVQLDCVELLLSWSVELKMLWLYTCSVKLCMCWKLFSVYEFIYLYLIKFSVHSSFSPMQLLQKGFCFNSKWC